MPCQPSILANGFLFCVLTPPLHREFRAMKELPRTNPTVFRKSDFELPAHAHRESLLYSKSGFTDFSGFKNLAMLCLFATCVRIIVENLRKYGILIDPSPIIEWININTTPSLNVQVFLSLNVFILLGWQLECIAAKYKGFGSVVHYFHYCNIAMSMFGPCAVIWIQGPAPLGALVVMFHVILVWSKLISYVQVNHHFRTVVMPKEAKVSALRSLPSTTHLAPQRSISFPKATFFSPSLLRSTTPHHPSP